MDRCVAGRHQTQTPPLSARVVNVAARRVRRLWACVTPHLEMLPRPRLIPDTDAPVALSPVPSPRMDPEQRRDPKCRPGPQDAGRTRCRGLPASSAGRAARPVMGESTHWIRWTAYSSTPPREAPAPAATGAGTKRLVLLLRRKSEERLGDVLAVASPTMLRSFVAELRKDIDQCGLLANWQIPRRRVDRVGLPRCYTVSRSVPGSAGRRGRARRALAPK